MHFFIRTFIQTFKAENIIIHDNKLVRTTLCPDNESKLDQRQQEGAYNS
jgi:hypothetical protein